MSKREKSIVALVGNPNSGKSSLFNILTGLRQQVGNFPGVTVDKKIGSSKLGADHAVDFIDLPGAYSLYPNSSDERVVVDILTNSSNPNFPDFIVYVLDAMNLERHLLLASQLIDLGIPMFIAMNMADIAEKEGLNIDHEYLQRKLGVDVIPISCKEEKNIDVLKEALLRKLQDVSEFKPRTFYSISNIDQQVVNKLKGALGEDNDYRSLLIAHHHSWLSHKTSSERIDIQNWIGDLKFEPIKSQISETMWRYSKFSPYIRKVQEGTSASVRATDRIDQIITHRIFGPLIFFGILFLIFQVIFSWAEKPMDWIEGAFLWMERTVSNVLPDSWFTSLLTEGIIAGFGGVVIFVPQIAILFVLIGLLEEVGYMARVAYIWDRFMQFFGLNGRSTVALISGGACAIPAIMSARTITNRKERLITILVTPFISCSARIPVYTVLIGFVVPSTLVFGIFNLQGIAFLGLYLLGILGGGLVALLLKFWVKSEERSFLALELPPYRMPSWRNVFLSAWSKVRSFIIEAGKIILGISIVLWFAASYGPGDQLAEAEAATVIEAQAQQLSESETANLIASKKLEASYAGHFGKFIEPVIRPLGFDWKIGIAILTSFAAREVFVSTMSTIYNIGSAEEDEMLIRDRMAQELRPGSDRKVYTAATSLALLVFYVFAMQCMSTVAVIRKETGGWKWAIWIFIISLLMAYFGAMVVYQLLA